MKNLLFALLLIGSIKIFAQEKPKFTLCDLVSPVTYSEFKKCAQIKTGIKNLYVSSFELVFNSVEGVAVYKITGDTFDENLLGLIEKAKPLKLHLNIFINDNSTEKAYKEVIFQMKY